MIKMAMIALITLTSIVLLSCDPTYPVSIFNNRTDTVIIETRTTVNFNVDKALTDYHILSGPYDHQVIRFKLAPGESVTCGMVIAGIDDEMPFARFMACSVKGTDTLIANTKEQILALFDKKLWGSIKTPYQLTIK